MGSKGRASKRRAKSGKRKADKAESAVAGILQEGWVPVEAGNGDGKGLSGPDFCYYCFDYGHPDGKCLDVYEDQTGGAQGKQAGPDVATSDAAAPDLGTDSSGGLEGDQDWRHRRLAFLRDQWERAERIRGLAQAFQKEIDQEEMWLRNNRYAPRPSYADGTKS